MQALKNTLAENTGGPSHDLAPEQHQFSLEQCPDLSGKVAVVTGGSEGIGYAVTRTLLENKIAKVFILSLSKDIIDQSTEAIRKDMGDEAAKKMIWLQCELSDWKQVTHVASQITSQTDRIDILVNNAARGIMTYQLTKDNVDLHMACNVFGHIVLTSHLLPLLKKTSKDGLVRIVNLASNAHQSAPKDTKFQSLSELNQDLGPQAQYGRSKLANILHARYLAKHVRSEYPNLLVNATHPGVVETRQSTEHIHEPYPILGFAMSYLLNPIKKTQFDGAVSTIYAATTTTQTGQYICPPAIPEPGSELAQDEALGEQLMKLSRSIVNDVTKATEQGCPMQDY